MFSFAILNEFGLHNAVIDLNIHGQPYLKIDLYFIEILELEILRIHITYNKNLGMEVSEDSMVEPKHVEVVLWSLT